MNERQFAVSGKWALGADNLQWILYRKYTSKGGEGWRAISFVSSERDILERCMREKGCPEQHRKVLLAGLPPTFKEWKKIAQSSSLGQIAI
jgi:hypothetical protein